MTEWEFRFEEDDIAWCRGFAEWKMKQQMETDRRRKKPMKNFDAYDPEKKFHYETMAVMGEYAAAHVLGIGMITDFRKILEGAADLEHGIEVRTIENPRYSLRFNDRSVLNRAYVLVVLQGQDALLKGWRRWNEETRGLCTEMLYDRPGRARQAFYVLPEIHLEPMAMMRTRLEQLRSGI